jgi:phosphoethanolamine N-methyltransferase
VFKKITKKDDQTSFQDFLDQQQYSKGGVLRYEKIFGPGFVSTGGLDTTKVCLLMIEIKTMITKSMSIHITMFY